MSRPDAFLVGCFGRCGRYLDEDGFRVTDDGKDVEVTEPEDAPGGPPPEMPYGRPRRPRRVPLWVWPLIAVVIVAIVVILAVTTTGGDDNKKVTPPNLGHTPSASPAPSIAPTRGPANAQEVKVTSCTADSSGHLSARVAVKNVNNSTLNYTIKIAFAGKGSGQQLGEGTIMIRNLGPGQSTDETATASSVAPSGGYSCQVADVTRQPGSGR
jgi:hypothetical protein